MLPFFLIKVSKFKKTIFKDTRKQKSQEELYNLKCKPVTALPLQVRNTWF